MQLLRFKGQPEQVFQNDIFQAKENLKGQSEFDLKASKPKLLKKIIEKRQHLKKPHEDKQPWSLLTELAVDPSNSDIMKACQKRGLVRSYGQVLTDFYFHSPIQYLLEADKKTEAKLACEIM